MLKPLLSKTGVAAQQMAIVSETKAVIFDKARTLDSSEAAIISCPSQVEHNPLTNNGQLAWVVEYDITNDAVRALNPKSNSFCAGGTNYSIPTRQRRSIR